MTRLLLILMLLVPTLARAAEWTWTNADTAIEVISAAATVVDWGQTNDIRRHAGMIELNPILGRTPSRQAVNNYFTGVLALHPVISLALPSKVTVFGEDWSPRKAWQWFYLGVEATAAVSNYRGGLRLHW